MSDHEPPRDERAVHGPEAPDELVAAEEVGSAPPRERRMAGRNRLVALVVALLVAGALVVDGTVADPEVGGVAAPFAGPVAAPESALSSTWFCPAGLVEPLGASTGEVVLANPTERDLSARVTVVPGPGEGDAVSEVVEVGALSETRRAIHELAKVKVAAVRVDVMGGGLGVEHSVSGAGGRSVATCSSGASSEWHLATGDTEKGARQAIVLYNPFPNPAIVDFRFATDDGFVAPPGLTGVVIDARAVRLVDVGEHVRREPQVATTIVARTGRFVAERYQVVDGSREQQGAALTLAAPSVGTQWTFPEGVVTGSIREWVHLYNPGDDEAIVDLEVFLDDGEAEPFALTVPPQGYVSVDVGEDGRVPPDVPHSLVVRSINGVGVVAEREVQAGDGAPRRGFTYLLGARRTAARWLLADGRTTAEVDEWVIVWNPGLGPTSVSVAALVGGQALPVADLQSVEVPARGRVAFRVGDHIERDPLALVVRATGPVVVERGLYAAEGIGMSAAIGIPLG